MSTIIDEEALYQNLKNLSWTKTLYKLQPQVRDIGPAHLWAAPHQNQTAAAGDGHQPQDQQSGQERQVSALHLSARPVCYV